MKKIIQNAVILIFLSIFSTSVSSLEPTDSLTPSPSVLNEAVIRIQDKNSHEKEISTLFKETLEKKYLDIQKYQGLSATGTTQINPSDSSKKYSFAWVESKKRTGFMSYLDNTPVFFWAIPNNKNEYEPSFFEQNQQGTLHRVKTLSWGAEPSPPLEKLPYWIKGIPFPGEPSILNISKEGTLMSLTQANWTTYYLSWYNARILLPRHIIIQAPQKKWTWQWQFDDWAWGNPADLPEPLLKNL